MSKLLLGVASICLLAVGVLCWLWPLDRESGDAPPPEYPLAADALERGRELVTLADCQSCHTERGGAPFAGGRAIPTPFGTFYSPNITPDALTGIGRWSASDFWHALHNGYSRDGKLLYPTFPYTNYTKISRQDADAMYAYLSSVPAATQPNRAHELRFPYDHRVLLTASRLLFFRPGVFQSDPAQSPRWNRGAYLVEGLGHCSACHEARNALGAIGSQHNPSGGLVLSWYAPALTSAREAGLRDWSDPEIVQLLKTGQIDTATGTSRHASTMGPMGEVVYRSLQYAHDEDLRAIAAYLKLLPESGVRSARGFFAPRHHATLDALSDGAAIYGQHCVQCHGEQGEGRAAVGPQLAGNRAVTMPSAIDPIRIVLYGGYPPGTAGNPRPFGMPPYSPALDDAQIADVLTFVRASWGNDAPPVSDEEVADNRGSPLW